MTDAMRRTITMAARMHNHQGQTQSGQNQSGQNQSGWGQPELRTRPKPKRRRAILLIGALVLLIVVAGAYYAYWRIVAQQLEAGIEAWAEQQRALGNEVAFEWDGIGGFPFRFAATFREPAIRWHWPRGST